MASSSMAGAAPCPAFRRGQRQAGARQVAQAELGQKTRHRRPQRRTPGRVPAPHRPDQPRLQQRVHAALVQRNAARRLDLRPGDRLVQGNQGQHLQSHPRQAPQRCQRQPKPVRSRAPTWTRERDNSDRCPFRSSLRVWNRGIVSST